MEILITYGHREEDLASLPIRDLALFVLEREGKPINTEVSISFVDDTAMAELNERFRGMEGPTDVLSFPMFDLSPGEKRRLRQLLLCLALFGAVFLGRGMDLGPVTELSQQVGQLVREDMDVQEVFARMGASFSQGEPAVETFRALWEDVTHWGEPEGS